jgi:hypothetical protein
VLRGERLRSALRGLVKNHWCYAAPSRSRSPTCSAAPWVADLLQGLKPNGIAIDRDGSFLIAHLGAEEGGVFSLTREGRASPDPSASKHVHHRPTTVARW